MCRMSLRDVMCKYKHIGTAMKSVPINARFDAVLKPERVLYFRVDPDTLVLGQKIFRTRIETSE